MEEMLALLKQKGWTIGSCESLTAGLFTSTLASISGASAVLKGGIVAYQSEVKARVVNVDDALIQTYGVISAPCAKQMAILARELLGCDICVSFTGNAGPDVMEGKPVGCVYCAIADANGAETYHLQFAGSRNEVRAQAVARMCEEVVAWLMKHEGDL